MKDTRVKLLQTAARMFSKKGYNGVSVRDIVSEAKVNISSIHYHFGDKQGLYLSTIQYLIQQTRAHLLAQVSLPEPEQISQMSDAQLLDVLHRLFDRLLDLKFDRQHIQLERMFTYAELESSDEMIKLLLSYVAPMSNILGKIISRLTGLKEKTPKLILLIHTIFWQLNISEWQQFVVVHILKKDKLDAGLRTQIKCFIWNNILHTLNQYKKGIKPA